MSFTCGHDIFILVRFHVAPVAFWHLVSHRTDVLGCNDDAVDVLLTRVKMCRNSWLQIIGLICRWTFWKDQLVDFESSHISKMFWHRPAPVSTDPPLWQPSVSSGQCLRIYSTERSSDQTWRWACSVKQPQGSTLLQKALLITQVAPEEKRVCAASYSIWLFLAITGPTEDKNQDKTLAQCQREKTQPNTHTHTPSLTSNWSHSGVICPTVLMTPRPFSSLHTSPTAN